VIRNVQQCNLGLMVTGHDLSVIEDNF
jgi:hypothetical protein